MRETKYRAWDKEDKRMIVDEQNYVPLIVTNKGVMKLNPYHKENLWSILDENRFNIMQYTGSKDENDREIYEGDLISFTNDTRLKGGGYTRKKYVALVGYEEKYCSYRANYIDVTGERQNLTLDWLNVKEVEVVGNIYENPELL